jgi:lysozyme family protein
MRAYLALLEEVEKRRRNNLLAAYRPYTHQPSQEVRGMHRHRFGGAFSGSDWAVVESAVVTPGQNGVDDIWLFVKRTIGGVTKRYIEVMQPPFEYGALEDAFQVDCGLSYSGAPVNVVSGLGHLNGETVDVLADGKVFRGLAVASGQVTLPAGAAAAKWQVGLPFQSEAGTLELDVGGQDGSLIGRRKKVAKAILSLLETDTTGLQVQSFIRGRWEAVRMPSIVAPDGKAKLYTGNVEVPIDDSGPGRAAKYLQAVLGVVQDGRIGPATLAAAGAKPAGFVIDALCDARLAFLEKLSTWPSFGRGWSARVASVRRQALLISAAPQTAVVTAPPEPASADEVAPAETPAGAGSAAAGRAPAASPGSTSPTRATGILALIALTLGSLAAWAAHLPCNLIGVFCQ